MSDDPMSATLFHMEELENTIFLLRREYEDTVADLKRQLNLANMDAFQCQAEASDLIRERDEAHIKLCKLYSLHHPEHRTPEEYADLCGWTCFRNPWNRIDETNNC